MKKSDATAADDPTTWRREFHRRLRHWYRGNARDLPWRRTRDPYAIWVSEIMLQQTQVATVIGYFDRFLAEFPDIASLAAATEEKVLRLWEGLGYYRRARQMNHAAQVIVEQHGGVFPSDALTVRALPGIGRYTSGAILSIAFDAREPILEANTIRLLARLSVYRGDPTSTDGQQRLWALAEELLPQRGAGEVNQALMELGSQVCTPRAPRCSECPVSSLCRAFARGLQDRIPAMRKKPTAEAMREAAVVVRRGDQVLLMRRPGHGRWGGLWNFPRFAIAADDASIEKTLAAEMKQLAGVRLRAIEKWLTYKHTVTRFRITLECFAATHTGGEPRSADATELQWFDVAELTRLPMPVTARKLCGEVLKRFPLSHCGKPARREGK